MVEGTLALNAVRVAAEAISTQETKARELAQDDARYYSTYLDIARKAIGGLEQAYIEILVEAAQTDLADEVQQRRLLTLIDGYIHGEVLRPALRDAITHLESGRDTLRRPADALLIWPSVKRHRSAALEQYDRLFGQLRGYLGQLGDYDEASAVGLEDLRELRAKAQAERTDAFEDKVNNLLVNLDKSRLTGISKDCASVIETLRAAFR